MTEIWRDVVNYVGFYQVSNFGRVKSLKRNRPGVGGVDVPVKERILKQGLNSHGRFLVSLWKDNRGRTFEVHPLVWDAFGNKVRQGTGLQVDHIDEDSMNNHIDNLQLLTQRENISKGAFNRVTSSIYTGVYWEESRGKWKSSIRVNGEYKNLGRFDNELDASQAYKDALEKFVNNDGEKL